MLFTTTNDLAEYIPSITEIDDFSLFSAEIKRAEAAVKLNFLGDIVLDDNTVLQDYCKPLVAYSAAIHFIPQLDLLLTNNGFVVTSNDNQSPASKERVERLINNYREETSQSVENLLVYLEKQDDLYNTWKTARYCSRFDDMPCATNTVFTQYAIGWDDRTSMDFAQQYARMMRAREHFLIPKLGKDFYTYILAHPTDDKITPIIHNFRQTFAAAVLDNKRVADNVLNSVMAYVIAHRTDYPEFDTWYEAPEQWENDDDNHIVALGI